MGYPFFGIAHRSKAKIPHTPMAMESRSSIPMPFSADAFQEPVTRQPIMNEAEPSAAAMQIAPTAVMNLFAIQTILPSWEAIICRQTTQSTCGWFDSGM
jgi:hypothetical protein